MDKVDGIIMMTLKSIGCEFECTFDEFDPEMVVKAVGQCILSINPAIEIHKSLPPNMAARYRVGSSLAEAIKMLGYQEDVGYYTFLYPSMVDMRKLFLFLIGKLPKRQSDLPKEISSPRIRLKRLIQSKILTALDKPWMPFSIFHDIRQYYHFATKTILFPFGAGKFVSEDKQLKYISHHLPILGNYLDSKKSFFPSLLEANCLHIAIEQNRTNFVLNKDHLLVKSGITIFKSCPDHAVGIENMANLASSYVMLTSDNVHFHKAEFMEPSQEHINREDEDKKSKNLDELEERIKRKSANVELVKSEIIALKDSVEEAKMRFQILYEKISKRKEFVGNRVNILELTPSAKDSLKNLMEMALKSKMQLENQVQKWKEHQGKMDETFDEVSRQAESNEIKYRHLLDDIKETKIKIRELASQAYEKEIMERELIEEYKNMTDGIKRSEYTQRVLEVVYSVNKQNLEIEKVIADTNAVQKEINALSGIAERTFVDADELIFKIARKDEYARKTYKLLAGLRENCNSLIELVEKTGTMLTEVSSLEEQIEQENKSNISESLESILKDYYQIKQENQVLLQDLKSRS